MKSNPVLALLLLYTEEYKLEVEYNRFHIIIANKRCYINSKFSQESLILITQRY